MGKEKKPARITEDIESIKLVPMGAGNQWRKITRSTIRSEDSGVTLDKKTVHVIPSRPDGTPEIPEPPPKRIELVRDLKDWQRSQGLTPCENSRCPNVIPQGRRRDTKYCSPRCKNANNQQQFRVDKPEEVEKIQMRHWDKRRREPVIR